MQHINNKHHNGDMARQGNYLVYVSFTRVAVLHITLIVKELCCFTVCGWNTIGFSTEWNGPYPSQTCMYTCPKQEELVPLDKTEQGDLNMCHSGSKCFSTHGALRYFSVNVLQNRWIQRMSCLYFYSKHKNSAILTHLVGLWWQQQREVPQKFTPATSSGFSHRSYDVLEGIYDEMPGRL